MEKLPVDKTNKENIDVASGPSLPNATTRNKSRRENPAASKSLKQHIALMNRNKAKMASKEDCLILKDDYEKAVACGELVKKQTGIIFDDKMLLHECDWNPTHAENPQRYRTIMERLKELDLIACCKHLTYEMIDSSLITKMHTPELYEKLDFVSKLPEISEMEKEATNYDSVYFNKETYNSAMISSSCAVQLIKEVCLGTVQNGLAIIRPPGHHAMKNDYCGFCFFNNVAIAAQYALDNKLATKILIIDYDVHHGQATQQMFYNSDKVMYFSIHRYEQGKFWPNLRESDYDYVGEGIGEGFNINFPLNAIGLGDNDYLSIVFHILLPLAYEFQPDLVIVSAGYDACIGCFEGQMEVTPGFYGHLMTLLSGLAQGKLAVCLEGGYFAPSLAEGVAMTLKGLLGHTPAMLKPLLLPHETTIKTINKLKTVLSKYWNCFKRLEDTTETECEYYGVPDKAPFETRFKYPEKGTYDLKKSMKMIKNLKLEYEKLVNKLPVCVCYDTTMLLHSSDNARGFELPERLKATYAQYKSWNLHERCVNLEPISVATSILHKIHSKDYVNKIIRNQFELLVKSSSDMFYNADTKASVLKSVDCLLTVVDSIMNKKSSKSGVALIRPPGHHAEKDKPAGFCYLNNVAIAAQYLLDTHKVDRILIIDFDIHHGNGTQAMFYENKSVLFISIHKYEHAEYFPNSSEASFNQCGKADGEGYNVNIPISGETAGNMDYISIFHRIILPIAYSFVPQVILISAGFDAGINDPLGNYHLTPDCFGHFIQMLKPLANGRLILALEGGYNITTLKFSINICIKTLLGDPLPLLDFTPNMVKLTTVNCINQVISAQRTYWPVLAIDKSVPLPQKLVEDLKVKASLKNNN